MAKVWLITGSSRGLGRALAEAVLEAGDQLIATARKASDLQDLVAKYGAEKVRAVALDVTDETAAREAIAAATSAFGRLDVVVNNAGYANISSIEDVDEKDFRTQFETNFFGVFHVTRAALPVLRAQGHGHIIQISSIGGRLGSAGLGSYQSAKWAVEGFSEVLAREVTSLGIKITIVEPGGFATDWAGSSMRIDQVRPEYLPSVGMLMRGHDPKTTKHFSRGDPAKGAQAIVKLAAMEAPPMRLLLGTDALFLAKMINEGRLAEDAKNRDLSASTDFDGAEDFADSAIGKMLSGRK